MTRAICTILLLVAAACGSPGQYEGDTTEESVGSRTDALCVTSDDVVSSLWFVYINAGQESSCGYPPAAFHFGSSHKPWASTYFGTNCAWTSIPRHCWQPGSPNFSDEYMFGTWRCREGFSQVEYSLTLLRSTDWTDWDWGTQTGAVNRKVTRLDGTTCSRNFVVTAER